MNPEAKPHQAATRSVPVALEDGLKKELDRLTSEGIIAPVVVPTDWVSALVVMKKSNGSLRLCLDPKPLNKELKRSKYPIPTVDDLTCRLAKAKVFTVCDAKTGYWHVDLEEKSSFLTTFGTPWGRYRWKRLPFGIAVASEEFQRRLNQELEGLEGIKAIADDILIYGEGETDEEAVADHDRKLKTMLERCRERGLKLNINKMKLKQKQVAYMGHLFTAKGLQVDPEKTRAIQDMPTPKDKKGVQRLLGMVNYLQKFSPSLSTVAAPLRQLLKDDVPFRFDEATHGEALTKFKKLIIEAPVLKYFSAEDETSLQVDASQEGLGACLMQFGQPVAYASRSLSCAERHYAQIEKEMLAIVYGLNKFERYTMGRTVTVQSNHKPLEQIQNKSLAETPKRLQRMMLAVQKFDFHIESWVEDRF